MDTNTSSSDLVKAGGVSNDLDGLWLSISELAEKKGVRKQSIAERVTRMEERGLIQTRQGKGRAKLVNLAQYDRVVGEIGDLGREMGVATKRLMEEDNNETPPSNDPIYTREQARIAAYRADILQLELQERMNKLVRVDKLQDVLTEGASEMGRIIDGIVFYADDIMAASSHGSHALRLELKKVATKMRSQIAQRFEAMAASAPQTDPPLES